jgi:hypothetical protein
MPQCKIKTLKTFKIKKTQTNIRKSFKVCIKERKDPPTHMLPQLWAFASSLKIIKDIGEALGAQYR